MTSKKNKEFESKIEPFMKKIITYGTFDLFHHGHLALLQRAKKLGDKLIVGLSTDGFNQNQKDKVSVQNFARRKKNLEAIKYVDLIISEKTWDQKERDIKNHEIDIFTIGDDWKGEFDFLKKFCEVIYLPRTPDISSTILREDIPKISR